MQISQLIVQVLDHGGDRWRNICRANIHGCWINGFSLAPNDFVQCHGVPQFSFPRVGEIMVTLFSFTLCFRNRGGSRSWLRSLSRSRHWLRSGSSDWLRSLSFGRLGSSGVLLGGSCVPFSLLCLEGA